MINWQYLRFQIRVFRPCSPLKSAVASVVRLKHCRPSGFTKAYFISVGTLQLRIRSASSVFSEAIVAVSQAVQDYYLKQGVERQFGLEGVIEC